jgi:hypothetical protein
MEDRFQDILDTLQEKPPRSRLEPYAELIGQLLRRRRTYRDIAGILEEKCQLRVSASTVHDFVRVRSRKTRKPAKRRETTSPSVSPQDVRARTLGVNGIEKQSRPKDEVRGRIAALKLKSGPGQAAPKQFQFDPNEPLRLTTKTREG